MASMALVIIYIGLARVVLNCLTGRGQGVEAILWVGGGVAMAEMSLLTRGQVRFGSSSVNTATERNEREVRLSR